MTPIEEWIKQEATKKALELFNAWTEKDEYKAFEDGWKSGATAMHQKMQGEITEKEKQLKESLLLYQNMCDQITKDNQEIDRLKGLISHAHQHGFARGQTKNETIEKSWEQFKSENNL